MRDFISNRFSVAEPGRQPDHVEGTGAAQGGQLRYPVL